MDVRRLLPLVFVAGCFNSTPFGADGSSPADAAPGDVSDDAFSDAPDAMADGARDSGAGFCGECETATDCSATTECAAARCIAGECVDRESICAGSRICVPERGVCTQVSGVLELFLQTTLVSGEDYTTLVVYRDDIVVELRQVNSADDVPALEPFRIGAYATPASRDGQIRIQLTRGCETVAERRAALRYEPLSRATIQLLR